MKFLRKHKGSISIFLTLVMLPMFLCAGLIMDAARISAAKTSVTGAGDLAMNSALSEYDQTLLDVYGLFAMSDSMDDLQENVSRYFSNTINNTGILEGSDSYTRNFINNIGSMFSNGDISFDNIVDTQVEDFKLVEVPDSSIANPTVLENQIVEYMKYRGPVNIINGLLTKLGCIGETSKQTKVIEKKVEYEKQLNTVQEACEAAYKSINEFNDLVAKDPFKGKYIDGISKGIENAKKSIQEMTEYIIASKSPDYQVDSISVDSKIRKDLNKEIDNSKEVKDAPKEEKQIKAYNYVKNKLKNDFDIEFEVASNGKYNLKDSNYKNLVENDLAFGSGGNLDTQTAFVEKVKANFDDFNNLYTYVDVLVDRYNKLSNDERKDLENEIDAYDSIRASIERVTNEASGLQSRWKETAKGKIKEGPKSLYDNYYPKLEEVESKLEEAIKALDEVLKKVENLDTVRSEWGKSVDDLSDNEIKTSMNSDYKNSAKNIDKTSVEALKGILEGNKKHFSAIKTKLEGITFYGKRVCDEESKLEKNFDHWYKSVPDNQTTDKVIADNYKSADVKTGIDPAKFTKITGTGKSKGQQFYKYLKKLCSSVEDNSQEAKDAKKENENLRDKMVDIGNDSKTGETNANGVDVKGKIITDSGLTEEISKAIDSLADSSTGKGIGNFNQKSMDKDNDKMAEQGKENLSGISALLGGLADVAKDMRDKVYLEEYFTEMFSCYTSGKDLNGNDIPEDNITSLSGSEMTGNKFYGGEVEYILWGNNENMEANISNTKALIFGIRFALNSIYAFTSSDTRTPALTAATAIAGWTGFGVPIVQTVILLAWSLAESTIDLEDLCAGKAVAVYKSKDTWTLGIGGLKSKAVEKLKETTNKAIDDIFEKVENWTVDSIDQAEADIKNYINRTSSGIVESIQGSIMTSLESLATQIIGESNMNLTEADIEKRIDEMLDSILADANSGSETDEVIKSVVNQIKNGGLDKISGKDVKKYIAESIFSAYDNANKGITSKISSTIEEMLKQVAAKITKPINDAVSKLGEDLKNEVVDIVKKGEDKSKEKINTAIDNFFGDKSNSKTNKVNLSKASTSKASGFTMTYKEYLKTFVLLELVGNKTEMLKRCAKLIQTNVSQNSSDFNISKAYTMVEVNASVSIRTTFFNVPVEAGVDQNGNTTYNLDFGNIGSDRRKIKYVGIIGY